MSVNAVDIQQNTKRSFINHLERKNICMPLLEDISIESMYEKII